MKTLLNVAVLLLLGSSAWCAECEERELAPGAVLEDGSVAGEAQTLDYLREREKPLYGQVAKLDKDLLRRRFGKHFVWFQRVGNCRTMQKSEMVRQIREQLLIEELLRKRAAAKSDPDKRDAEAAIRDAVVAQFESDLWLAWWELEGFRQNQPEAPEIAALETRAEKRRQARSTIVAKRVAELLAGN